MEKIEISTRFNKDGALIPQEIKIRKEVVPILNVGRGWETPQGRHILVMDALNRTYHLFFQTADLSWYWIRDLKGPAGAV